MEFEQRRKFEKTQQFPLGTWQFLLKETEDVLFFFRAVVLIAPIRPPGTSHALEAPLSREQRVLSQIQTVGSPGLSAVLENTTVIAVTIAFDFREMSVVVSSQELPIPLSDCCNLPTFAEGAPLNNQDPLRRRNCAYPPLAVISSTAMKQN